MSVQFGKWNFDGKPVDPRELEEVRPVLAPYGPDGEGYICQGNIVMLYRAFHTTKESRREQQPCQLKSGTVVTWDGRLDNREELIPDLGSELSQESTDLDIVCAAYERWETHSFRKLIGDWAISIWDPKEHSLIIAKDFVGTRHLYYRRQNNQVTWCTILDPLVLYAGRSFELEQEYIAGWLSAFPATHLTPYVGVSAVPPSSFVRITSISENVQKYWEFDSGKRIRYRTDAEYEEHFRAVFSQSVRRSLRSDSPVLAELSGGMDSSSIVCVADTISSPNKQSVDTMSYYDDNEPNWDERPYFTRVESQRGRAGLHIDIGSESIIDLLLDARDFRPIPASDLMPPTANNDISAYLVETGHRTLLSGVGGDEVLGGVPTPTPKLADLLARGRLLAFAKQLQAWALNKRKPILWLFGETLREFLPVSIWKLPKHRKPADWIHPEFVRRWRCAFRGYEEPLRIFGSLPSFQESLRALEGLRRQLACSSPRKNPGCEVRYPYLDRDLLEFLYSIPREQLVRPGQRRSLMRRAMTGIVPAEILARRRKAFVARSTLKTISAAFSALERSSEQLKAISLKLVDSSAFSKTLESARQGQEIDVAPVLRLLILESWLRDVYERGLFLSAEPSRFPIGSMPILISAENLKAKGGDLS